MQTQMKVNVPPGPYMVDMCCRKLLWMFTVVFGWWINPTASCPACYCKTCWLLFTCLLTITYGLKVSYKKPAPLTLTEAISLLKTASYVANNKRETRARLLVGLTQQPTESATDYCSTLTLDTSWIGLFSVTVCGENGSMMNTEIVVADHNVF